MLADPNVSRFHAEVVRRDGRVRAGDLGSRNGTRVNGELVERAVLEPGSEVGIGPYRLTFDGAAFVAATSTARCGSTRGDVVVEVREKRILDRRSLRVEPGEFVAFIGESGSGKTTLIKALAGVTSPTAASHGQRRADRRAPHRHRLRAAGRDRPPGADGARGARVLGALRLPADTSDEEIAQTVERVLEEVALDEHADTRIGSLSGGQRKRAGVASELLGRPSLLFLDEPTTGLDPGLETQMMALLRELAERSRAVIVVTHATKNLGLCDKVAVMGRGGDLTYFGPPDGRLEFFGVDDYDGVYGALERRRRPSGASCSSRSATRAQPPASPKRTERAGARERRRARLAQTRMLAGRYLKVLRARPAQPRAAARPGAAARARERRAVQDRRVRPAGRQAERCDPAACSCW